MHSSRTAWWVGVFTLVAAASALSQGGDAVPIEGRISDIYTRDGRVAGATVRITERVTGATLTLVTDENGMFFVDAARPGLYTIRITAPGYESLTTQNFCVVAGKPASFHAGLGPDRRTNPARPAPTAPPANETVVYTPQSVPGAGALSLSDVERAIAFGRKSGSLKPPRLGARALLLPPFWRVGSMAQVADGAGKPFTAGESPAAFVENVAWIVVGPRSYYVNDGGEGPEYLIGVSDIVIRPRDAKTEGNDVRPAWKMYLTNDCEVNILANVLGRHFKRPGVVAAFQMQALIPGATVVFTYAKFAAPRDEHWGVAVPPRIDRVVIRQKDLDAWK